MAWLLSAGSTTLPLFLERGSQAIEACLPQAAVLREPPVKLAEGFRPERIEATLSIRPHRDEARFMEDAQMAGDTGLVDTRLLDDVVDLLLAVAQHFDDAAARLAGCGS
jgi:hypothetical protein